MMVGVNGVYWRIKCDDWRMEVATRDGHLARATFYQTKLRDNESISVRVGEFAGQMVVVFDPSDDVMVQGAPQLQPPTAGVTH